jgi:hypothetical protein
MAERMLLASSGIGNPGIELEYEYDSGVSWKVFMDPVREGGRSRSRSASRSMFTEGASETTGVNDTRGCAGPEESLNLPVALRSIERVEMLERLWGEIVGRREEVPSPVVDDSGGLVSVAGPLGGAL